MPVSVSSAETCPPSCPFKDAGCYAAVGNLAIHWRKVTGGLRGMNWQAFLSAIQTIPRGALWRHNQAGDLPGKGEKIDADMLKELTKANEGRRGFTYTHKLPTPKNLSAIRQANAGGFVVNLSANDLRHADKLKETGLPVVVVLLIESVNGPRKFNTPAGNTVVVCPATYSPLTCLRCGICANGKRQTIVGFPAHGIAKQKVDKVARGGKWHFCSSVSSR